MAEERREYNSGNHGFRFFIYGGVVGALATLLFAPRSGKQTREMLADKAQETRESMEKGIRRAQEGIKEKKESLRSDAEELLDKARNLTAREKATIMAAMEAGKAAYREEKEAHK